MCTASCSRLRHPVTQTLLIITLATVPLADCLLSVATAVILRAKFLHVLVHQLLGLVDVACLGVHPLDESF